MKFKLHPQVFILTVFDIILLLGTFAYLGYILRNINHHLLIEDILMTTLITSGSAYGFYKTNDNLLNDNHTWMPGKINKFLFVFILNVLMFLLMIVTIVLPIVKII